MADLAGLLIVAGLFAGLTALIVARVATRWLGLVMLLWLSAPLLLMVATLGIGSLLSPPQGSIGSNAVFALMIIGLAALVPWIMVCAIGGVIGLLLRRRRTGTPAVPGVEASAPPLAIIPSDGSAHLSHMSPDGSFRIDIQPVEWAAGQWMHTPRIVEAASGRILCDLLGSDWEAQTAFPREGAIWLGLRRFRSPGHLFVDFDLATGQYRIATDTLDRPDEQGALGDVTDRIEHWWSRASTRATARSPEPSRPVKPHPFAAWRTALVILVASLAAIAGLTYVSLRFDIDSPHVPFLRPGATRPG